MVVETTVGTTNKTKKDLRDLEEYPKEPYDKIIRRLIANYKTFDNTDKVIGIYEGGHYIKKRVKPFRKSNGHVYLPGDWVGECVVIMVVDEDFNVNVLD